MRNLINRYKFWKLKRRALRLERTIKRISTQLDKYYPDEK